MKPKFFPSPAAFGAWLKEHHDKAKVLIVGYYKVGTGRPSLTWQQSVDEALCWGWIDGVRNSLDEKRYVNRFTPRKRNSKWSAVNIRRARALIREKRMKPPGRKAFDARRENRSGGYSYENRPQTLPEPYARMLSKNGKARAFFDAQPPGYRRMATWWILSAAKEDTRLRRMRTLVDVSVKGKRI